MAINPAAPQGPRRGTDPAALEANRAQEARRPGSGNPEPGAADSTRPRADSVDLSADARALSEQQEVRSAKSSLPTDRLKEIGERLATGFYDQPEVIESVARRISADPGFRADG